jgi:hypothetical protein
MTTDPIKEIKTRISPLAHILFGESLQIPEYQRPYKWSVKNVNQLLDDILMNTKKSAYRLGTVVLHRQRGLNIVDGQHRLMTLTLIAAELLKLTRNKMNLETENMALSQHIVIDPVSLRNLTRNHAFIRGRIKEFDDDHINFFFEKCELVWIELNDISEAFQFFDAQNSRGLDLKPHDLLKAFHLREMAGTEELMMRRCASVWEASSDKLPVYLGQYLFKVRRWSQGRPGLHFSKDDVGVFKGIQPQAIGEAFLFEKSYRLVDGASETGYKPKPGRYPFQLDQPVINGQRFFDFVGYYSGLISEVMELEQPKYTSGSLSALLREANPLSVKILSVLNTYGGRNRRGDRYLRNVLDCCLLYYLDKFGRYKMDIAFNRFFFWVYALRLEKFAVQEVTVDTLAREGGGFFRLIRDAVHPSEFIHKELKPVKYLGDKESVADIEAIVALFKTQQTI